MDLSNRCLLSKGYPNDNFQGYAVNSELISTNYTEYNNEITFEQFKKYVLKEGIDISLDYNAEIDKIKQQLTKF